MHKILLSFFLLLITLGGGYSLYKQVRYWKEPVPQQVTVQEVMKTTAPAEGVPGEVPAATPLPDSLNLAVPFYAQAPFEDWDYPWQEACEEASVLLAANVYYEYNWTRTEFNDWILKLVDWENKTFGDYKHTDMDQTARMLKEELGLDSVIHENPTFEDIQRILARGHLIVMPFAGKLLGNPHYRNGGPMYHVLLIKGYKEGEKLITNDVGTKYGADYVFTWSVIQNALHDYSDGKPIEEGPKRFLEVLPPEGFTADMLAPNA